MTELSIAPPKEVWSFPVSADDLIDMINKMIESLQDRKNAAPDEFAMQYPDIYRGSMIRLTHTILLWNKWIKFIIEMRDRYEMMNIKVMFDMNKEEWDFFHTEYSIIQEYERGISRHRPFFLSNL